MKEPPLSWFTANGLVDLSNLEPMKRLINRLIRRIRRALRSPDSPDQKFQVKAYSQQGEDLVVNCLLQWNTTGFYIDIGAHHPFRYSNTHLFYLKGWHGINIDPRPGIAADFSRYRPNDINLEVGVGANRELSRIMSFPTPQSTRLIRNLLNAMKQMATSS